LTWEPLKDLTLRATYLKSIARPRQLERSLAPTQVAGFNQLFDDRAGSEIKQAGIGFDLELGYDLSIGAEYNRRDLETPLDFGAAFENRDEKRSLAYLYWAATDRLGIHLSYEKEEYKRDVLSLEELTTKRTPIGISYHLPSGFYLQTVGTYIDQEIQQSGITERENFWNVDTVAGYRLPRRYGKIELIIKNTLDEDFRYYDLSFHSPDIQMPEFQPERQLFARFSVDF
jgi:hypothetical protein